MTNASTAIRRQPLDTQAWMRAAGDGDAASIMSLLAAGADVNAATESGETALIRATSMGHLHIVRLLLEAGADPNAEREDGFTALWIAVFVRHVEIVRALLACGADLFVKGRLDTTVEQWARYSGFTEIVEMFKVHSSMGEQHSVEGESKGTAQADAPPFFPAEGTFSPVVPLSRIDDAFASSENFWTAGELAEAVESNVIISGGTGDEHVLEEQEVTTIVPPRISPATLRSPSPSFRPTGLLSTWPVVAAALTLSLIAGLIAGTSLIGSRWSAETKRIAPFAVTAAPAIEDVAPQVEESKSPASTSNLELSQPVPQLSAMRASNKTEALATSVNTGTTSVETYAKHESVKADESVLNSAPRETTTSRRTPHAEPLAHDATTPVAQPAHSAPKGKGGSANSPAIKPAQHESATISRVSNTGGASSSTTALPMRSLPVASPPSSAKSKKVIHWP